MQPRTFPIVIRAWSALGMVAWGVAPTPAQAAQPADLNGDEAVTVADVQLLILLALGEELPGVVDGDGDGRPDGCELAQQARFGAGFAQGWAGQTACALLEDSAVPPAPGGLLACGDMNGDGGQNVADIVVCVQLVLGLDLAAAVDAGADGVPDGWHAGWDALLDAGAALGAVQAQEHEAGCGTPCGAGTMCCGGACVLDSTAPECDPPQCDDGDPCTEDVCADSGCQHAPVDCDDSVACTVDYCDPASGCGAWPDHRRCGDGEGTVVCDPSDPSSNLESGCSTVDSSSLCYPSNYGLSLGLFCGGGPPSDGDGWTPPNVGDPWVCTLDLAAGDLACADDWLGCFLRMIAMRLTWPDTLELQSLSVEACTAAGCELWPLPFAPGSGAGEVAPNGIYYAVLEATSADDWKSTNHELLYIKPPYKLPFTTDGTNSGPAPHAYLDGNSVIGDPLLFRMSFDIVQPVDSSVDLAVCVNEVATSAYTPPGLSSGEASQWPKPVLTIDDDGLIVVSPGNGWMCTDEDLCTIDTFLPGLGCDFDPILPEDCDDGLECTMDGCSPETGECRNTAKKGDKQCPVLGDFCIPDSPFADQTTGCVDDMWSHVCYAGIEFCELSTPVHWDGEYGPAEGDYLICPIRMARSAEVCPNPEDGWCLPASGYLRLGFDPDTLTLVGGYDTVCYEGVGCYLTPWFDSTGEYALDTGHFYSGGPDIEDAGEWGWSTLSFLSFNPFAILSYAYLDADGAVVGNDTIADLWFALDPDIPPGTSTTICADNMHLANKTLHEMPIELNEEGIIVVYPPE